MIEHLELTKLSTEDYKQLLAAMKASYPDWQGSFWGVDSIRKLIEKFPDGQVVVKVNGEVVGCAQRCFGVMVSVDARALLVKIHKVESPGVARFTRPPI